MATIRKKPSQNVNNNPYIFVIDLDGTIIGDCSYQCEIYNIQEIIKKNIAHTKQMEKKLSLGVKTLGGNNRYKNICEKSLQDCYKPCSKLIRPYFGFFINKMKKTFPNSLFYIYTASEKAWAHKEVAIIEKQNRLKFNRPIFTRNDCIIDSNGNYCKSIAKILPYIKNTNYNIKDRLLIIDNNPTFIDYTDNLLVCPTYNYLQFKNLWENIPQDYDKIDELKRYVYSLISNKKIHTKANMTDAVKLEKIHKWLYRKYKNINKNNSRFENDVFWKDLAYYIQKQNITIFNKKIIREIQQKLI